jgi:serine/threonine protein kinase
MAERYQNQLSYGANNLVVALNDTEVAKTFRGDTRSDIGSEAEKLKVANNINGLIVNFIRIDYDEVRDWDMLVMERLYPLDFRSLEIGKRELMLDVFTDEVRQLHQAGFVHRDIRRPSDQTGERYDNVFLTDRGLRLIDVGISALKAQVGEKLFARYVAVEEQEMAEFGAYFLSR